MKIPQVQSNFTISLEQIFSVKIAVFASTKALNQIDPLKPCCFFDMLRNWIQSSKQNFGAISYDFVDSSSLIKLNQNSLSDKIELGLKKIGENLSYQEYQRTQQDSVGNYFKSSKNLLRGLIKIAFESYPVSETFILGYLDMVVEDDSVGINTQINEIQKQKKAFCEFFGVNLANLIGSSVMLLKNKQEALLKFKQFSKHESNELKSTSYIQLLKAEEEESVTIGYKQFHKKYHIQNHCKQKNVHIQNDTNMDFLLNLIKRLEGFLKNEVISKSPQKGLLNTLTNVFNKKSLQSLTNQKKASSLCAFYSLFLKKFKEAQSFFESAQEMSKNLQQSQFESLVMQVYCLYKQGSMSKPREDKILERVKQCIKALSKNEANFATSSNPAVLINFYTKLLVLYLAFFQLGFVSDLIIFDQIFDRFSKIPDYKSNYKLLQVILKEQKCNTISKRPKKQAVLALKTYQQFYNQKQQLHALILCNFVIQVFGCNPFMIFSTSLFSAKIYHEFCQYEKSYTSLRNYMNIVQQIQTNKGTKLSVNLQIFLSQYKIKKPEVLLKEGRPFIAYPTVLYTSFKISTEKERQCVRKESIQDQSFKDLLLTRLQGKQFNFNMCHRQVQVYNHPSTIKKSLIRYIAHDEQLLVSFQFQNNSTNSLSISQLSLICNQVLSFQTFADFTMHPKETINIQLKGKALNPNQTGSLFGKVEGVKWLFAVLPNLDGFQRSKVCYIDNQHRFQFKTMSKTITNTNISYIKKQEHRNYFILEVQPARPKVFLKEIVFKKQTFRGEIQVVEVRFQASDLQKFSDFELFTPQTQHVLAGRFAPRVTDELVQFNFQFKSSQQGVLPLKLMLLYRVNGVYLTKEYQVQINVIQILNIESPTLTKVSANTRLIELFARKTNAFDPRLKLNFIGFRELNSHLMTSFNAQQSSQGYLLNIYTKQNKQVDQEALQVYEPFFAKERDSKQKIALAYSFERGSQRGVCLQIVELKEDKKEGLPVAIMFQTSPIQIIKEFPMTIEATVSITNMHHSELNFKLIFNEDKGKGLKSYFWNGLYKKRIDLLPGSTIVVTNKLVLMRRMKIDAAMMSLEYCRRKNKFLEQTSRNEAYWTVESVSLQHIIEV